MPDGIDVFLERWLFPNGIQDTVLAIWKECSNLAPVTVGQTIEVYGTTLTVRSISPSEIVLFDADDQRVWSVPSWPWTSAGA